MLTEEERIYIKNTLALMNCIIKSGECHSKQSNEMLTKSFEILLREAEPAQIAQKNEFVIPDVSGSLLLDEKNDIDTVGNCPNCGVEFHIHKQ